MYCKSTKLDQDHEAIFEIKKLLFFLLIVNYSTFNFQSKGENYKASRDIFVRTLDIELDRDWSVGLCTMLGDGHTHTFFSETLFQNVEVIDNRNLLKQSKIILFNDCTTFFNTSVARKYCKYEKHIENGSVCLKKCFPVLSLKSLCQSAADNILS